MLIFGKAWDLASLRVKYQARRGILMSKRDVALSRLAKTEYGAKIRILAGEEWQEEQQRKKEETKKAESWFDIPHEGLFVESFYTLDASFSASTGIWTRMARDDNVEELFVTFLALYLSEQQKKKS